MLRQVEGCRNLGNRLMTSQESPRAVAATHGPGKESLPADYCVAEGFDNILPVVTAEHVLPMVALDMFPELRGTVWHRIGWRTACTVMAYVLLDDARANISFARAVARAVCCSGQVVALDGRVLVLSDERAVVIGDRALFVRCSDG